MPLLSFILKSSFLKFEMSGRRASQARLAWHPIYPLQFSPFLFWVDAGITLIRCLVYFLTQAGTLVVVLVVLVVVFINLNVVASHHGY